MANASELSYKPSLQFAEDMRLNGIQQKTVEDQFADEEHMFQHISRTQYIHDVQDLMKRSRGREFPGAFDPLIVADLFYEQARSWERLVEVSCKIVLESTRVCLSLVLDYVTDTVTCTGVENTFLNNDS